MTELNFTIDQLQDFIVLARSAESPGITVRVQDGQLVAGLQASDTTAPEHVQLAII